MSAISPELSLVPVPEEVTMRGYQLECVKALHFASVEFDRMLVVMATAGGKTVIFCQTAKECLARKGSFCNSAPRVLILVNREELLEQAARQVQKITGVYAAIERAQSHGNLESQIVVATIQSMQKRLGDYPTDHFGLVVVDEAHLFASPKIVETLNYFCYADGAKLIGFTATPQTKGKRALSKIYETIAFEKGIAELIREKWLCNIKVQTVPIKIDLSTVGSKAGDYLDEDLDAVVTPYFHEVAKAMKFYGPKRKWLCFLPLIKTSQHFADVLNENGIATRHVDGKSEDRKEILVAFRQNQFQALSNSLLVTTGYDEPSITGIVNLRPTKSRILLTQMVGRGTRLKPPESACDDLLILDPLWQNADLSELMSPAALFAATEEDEKELTKKLRSGDELDLMETHEEVRKERHAKLAAALKANERKLGKLLDFAALLNLGIEASPLFVAAVDYEPTMEHHTRKPTQGQLSALSQMGVDIRIIKDFGHASAMMEFCVDRMRRHLCTFKQANALLKAGYKIDPDKLSISEASQLISRLYGNR